MDILIFVMPKERMYTLIRMVKMQHSDANPCGDVERQERSFMAGGNATWCRCVGRQFGSSLQN